MAVLPAVDETQGNPYLEGVFAPVDAEVAADQLTVIGEIPADVEGILVLTKIKGCEPMQVYFKEISGGE
jgi:carotenoid cleavage dioxygenase-like enzyme